MEKKITLFHGSEKVIEYQTYLEMMDDETDGIYSRNCPDSSCCFYRVGLRGRSSQSPLGGSVNTGNPSGWRYRTQTDYW